MSKHNGSVNQSFDSERTTELKKPRLDHQLKFFTTQQEATELVFRQLRDQLI